MRTRHGIGVICGSVNAKNSFGAYEGSAEYIVMGSVGETRDAATATQWRKLWKGFCVDTDATDAAVHGKKE